MNGNSTPLASRPDAFMEDARVSLGSSAVLGKAAETESHLWRRSRRRKPLIRGYSPRTRSSGVFALPDDAPGFSFHKHFGGPPPSCNSTDEQTRRLRPYGWPAVPARLDQAHLAIASQEVAGCRQDPRYPR